MHRIGALAALLVVIGCGGTDNPVARAAGSWPGRFAIETSDGKSDETTLVAEQMKGNLELYATGMKFKLEMATPRQRYNVNGKWKAQRNRVTLYDGSCTFDNPTEEDQKALSIRIITPDELRAVFTRDIVLSESEDRRRLTGLKTSLGRLVGRLEFERPIPH